MNGMQRDFQGNFCDKASFPLDFVSFVCSQKEVSRELSSDTNHVINSLSDASLGPGKPTRRWG